MSYFGVSTRNGVGLGLGTVPSLTNTPLSYRLAPSLSLSFAGSDSLSPAITFSRTSNATLTNSAGLVANAPMNLLTYSEQFDNAAWSKLTGGTGVAPVVTANAAAAPNGTTTADQVVFNRGAGTTSSDVSYLAFSLTAFTATATASVWLKTTDGTTKTMSFRCGAPAAQQITVTGEWQRFTLTQTNATIDRVQILLYGNDGAQTVSVYIWGAQLELGSTATTYNPTTVKNLLGYTENFDNAAWTKSNAFVQTNLLTYSQDFDNAAWAKTGATVTANSVVAPDGSTTADSLIESNTNALHILGSALQTITAGVTYAMSVYAKADTRSVLQIAPSSSSFGATAYANFDLSTGVVSASAGGTATISPEGNGWFRCVFVVVATSTGSTGPVNLVLQNSPTAARVAAYAGDGTSGLYIWGAQLVQGTSAGDYKATYAAAAAVGYTDIYGQPFAQKLVENTATSTHTLFPNAAVTLSTGVAYAYSVYAKAAERSICRLTNNDLLGAFFDLATGEVTSVSAGFAGSIEGVGNGWYRLGVVQASNSNTSGRLAVSLVSTGTTTSYTGDGTSGIYIFGAQLSDSASVDPYVYNPVAAPASTAYYGPRFDYDPVTLAPKGLLIEEQRTNLLTYSEQFDNTAWFKANCSVQANVATAPDGTITADKFVENNTNNSRYVALVSSWATVGSTYALSVCLKAGERQWAYVGLSNENNKRAWFNLSAGTTGIVNAGVTSASIQAVGNGWYRCTVVFPAGVVNPYPSISATTENGTTAYQGDGTSGIYIWGAQLEAGAFATSYIPTVASQVTRAADSASMIWNNFARWYNVNEGTLFAQYDFAGYSAFNPVFDIGADQNNLISMSLNSAVNSRLVVVSGGVTQANIVLGLATANTVYKQANAYKVDDFAATRNGATALTDAAGTIPVVAQAAIGGTIGLSRSLNGHISRITYYPRRLSNSELQSITT